MNEELWYERLGFYENPFSIRPEAFPTDMVGPTEIVQLVNERVDEGTVTLLLGEYGAGKTTSMKKIIGKFRGDKKVIYYSCNRKSGAVDFDKLLYKRSWYNSLFRIKPKDMILLLDEAQYLNSGEQHELIKDYEDGFFKSIVLITHNLNDIILTPELKDLIGSDVYRLRLLSPEEAVELVRDRIGDLEILSDDMIKEIHSFNKNPRRILENCEDVCREAVEQGDDQVMKKHLKVLKKK